MFPSASRPPKYAVLLLALGLSITSAFARQAAPAQSQVSPSSVPAQATQQTRAQRRAQRRAPRNLAAASTTQTQPAASDAAKRALDQKLLDQQKAQSAETARENDAVTRKTVRDRQQVQAEPRIQDAPGPGAQPLPGDPAVQPAQPADPPRIQDAPGPAQTLPKAPPPAPAPAPQL